MVFLSQLLGKNVYSENQIFGQIIDLAIFQNRPHPPICKIEIRENKKKKVTISPNAIYFKNNKFYLESKTLPMLPYDHKDFYLAEDLLDKQVIDTSGKRLVRVNDVVLEVNGELNFSQCSFYKNSEINFDDISGKFSLYKTNFSDKCYLEYELLENKGYEPLIFEDDFKRTKWNFLTISDIYKSSGRTEQYLKTFYYFKKYERLERKSKNKANYNFLEYLIEITTKYYTSWERTLLSMGLILVAFFIVYCIFPNLLIYKDTIISPQSLFKTIFEMCETSTLDINFLISKFGNALYFTIITFTTVGYGDIMPLNWMKLVVSLESFLGVFFTASFVVTLSRRFLS